MILATETEAPGAADVSLRNIYRRITLRVVPFLILLYFVAFLDRVNVSFASLTMNRDLHIGEDMFGLAAGIFFLGYLLFAVPGNLLLVRFGANRWIALLMILWGSLSCALAFVHAPSQYIVLRFLIGAAEASFFPGIILYLTRWLPSSVLAGIMALFTLSIPLSNIIGAPLSAAILTMNGMAGLRGWQWLFLLEGIPSVLLGCLVPWALPRAPGDVAWLSADEKQGLLAAIEKGMPHTSGQTGPSAGPGSPVQLAIPSVIYFVLMMGLYALSFWVPRILSSHGIPLSRLGWMTAVPYVFGGVGMLIWSRRSDKTGQRQIPLVVAFSLASAGMLTAALSSSWPVSLLGFALSGIGVFSSMPIFWASISQRFGPVRAPVVIAAVNSVGNIGGFVSPLAMGWLLQKTHQYRPGLLVTAGCLLIGALLVALTRGLSQNGPTTNA